MDFVRSRAEREHDGEHHDQRWNDVAEPVMHEFVKALASR
jgi:hypothetical protein